MTVVIGGPLNTPRSSHTQLCFALSDLTLLSFHLHNATRVRDAKSLCELDINRFVRSWIYSGAANRIGYVVEQR